MALENSNKLISLGLLSRYDEKLKTYIGNLITAANGDIDAVQALVTTLIGEDANKSVRTIANEELVKQLIPENAKEALDTLQEIAAWIQSHPDDAADFNKRIGDLETAVGAPADGETAASGLYKVIADAVAAEQERAEGDVDDLAGTAVSASSSADNAVVATLGGTVESPTVAIAMTFAANTDIDALFEGEEEKA